MVRDTPPSLDASTYQILNSYLKEYRRYAPDTKRDGRTDSAITICLPKFLWGHKNSNTDIQVNQKILVIYIAKKLFESAYIYTHALLKSKQWISIYKKPYI